MLDKKEKEYKRKSAYKSRVIRDNVHCAPQLSCRKKDTFYPQSSTLYIYYIYIELACTQSPFFQNLPYECTRCKQ